MIRKSPHKNILMGLTLPVLLLLSYNSAQSTENLSPDGTLINGTRIIKMVVDPLPKKLTVYRGDAIELKYLKTRVPSCSIPEIKNVVQTENDSFLSVKFTAADTGKFRILSRDTKLISSLNVVEYKTKGKSMVKNLTGSDAVAALTDTSILILDVRTPGEFADGHIPNAKLVPVSELANRIQELADYKDKPLFVYCRSGNRSAVAIQILTSHDFSNILHLRGGIKSWQGKVVK